jgi:hypothetical protein
MSLGGKLPPFPERSAILLERLAAGVVRRRPAINPASTGPSDTVIIDLGNQKGDRYAVGKILLTRDEVPVYRIDSVHEDIEAAFDEVLPCEGEIEIEDD